MRFIVAIGMLLSSSAAWAGSEMRAVTPSGRAEMMFRDSTAQDTSGKLASKCMANGLTVVTSSANDVTCQLKMNMLKSALAQALIGNSYSTPPQTFVRFTITQLGSVSRVQANEWMETQMAFGQMRRQELANDDVHNDLMIFMETAGATYVGGTTFPNHAYLGLVASSGSMVDFKGKQTAGLVLGQSVAGGALDRSGAKLGDTLVAIDGKTFKTQNDINKRLKGIPIDEAMTVTVLRGGTPVELSAVASRRPSIPADNPAMFAAAPVAPSVVPAASFSVADELGKLMALKDKGVLTDAEFQTQKASLLSK